MDEAGGVARPGRMNARLGCGPTPHTPRLMGPPGIQDPAGRTHSLSLRGLNTKSVVVTRATGWSCVAPVTTTCLDPIRLFPPSEASRC